MKRFLPLATAACGLSLSMTAAAEDLSAVYDLAVANDAQVAAARATREADSYNATIARGGLLPQASASYTWAKGNSDSESYSTIYDETTNQFDLVLTGRESDYTATTLELNASMPLFNLNTWYNYKAALSVDSVSDLTLKIAEQSLILRTADVYFGILRAQDNLAAAEAEVESVEQSLEQVRQRYEVGLSPVTELNEAQAAYDLSYVNLLDMQASLEISYEAMESLTGSVIKDVDPLKENADLNNPQPEDASAWVTSGMEGFPGLLTATAQLESARLSRNATKSNHLPTVNLFASYSDETQSIDGYDDDLDTTTKMYGLQVTVPLLAGGSNYAATKQAALSYAAADATLEQQKRELKQNIRSLYLQVRNSVRNIAAREQAIRSARSALDATETGYKVGTRNIVELLNAKRNLFAAGSDYANARYDYIINLLNLKYYAGVLSEGDVAELNRLLK